MCNFSKSASGPASSTHSCKMCPWLQPIRLFSNCISLQWRCTLHRTRKRPFADTNTPTICHFQMGILCHLLHRSRTAQTVYPAPSHSSPTLALTTSATTELTTISTQAHPIKIWTPVLRAMKIRTRSCLPPRWPPVRPRPISIRTRQARSHKTHKDPLMCGPKIYAWPQIWSLSIRIRSKKLRPSTTSCTVLWRSSTSLRRRKIRSLSTLWITSLMAVGMTCAGRGPITRKVPQGRSFHLQRCTKQPNLPKLWSKRPFGNLEACNRQFFRRNSFGIRTW